MYLKARNHNPFVRTKSRKEVGFLKTTIEPRYQMKN
jgi:hypothetical protein